MKKRNLKKLALLGLTTGLVVSSQNGLNAQEQTLKTIRLMLAQRNLGTLLADNSDAKSDPNSQNSTYHLMTEADLLLELNDEGTKIYNSLDAEGKELARYVASQACQGTNRCKGLNACKTDHNECAGKGSCEGKGKCALSDKNLAVKLAAKKMAEKRHNSMQRP